MLDVVIVLGLPDSKKSEDDTWNGAGVEKCVTQLDNQMRAAATNAVKKNS